MENIKEILNRLCLFYGVSNNRKLSEKININYNTVSTWIKRDSIPYEKLHKIVQKESISYDWLLTGKGEMLIKEENGSTIVLGNGNVAMGGQGNSIDNSFNAKKKRKKENSTEIISIPYLENTYAAAGYGAINYDEAPHPMSFDKNFLQSHFGLVSFTNLHIINAIGNSMEPTFKEGELLMINPFENENMYIKDGGIYVISCNSSVLVKRINHNPISGKVTLISDNKEYDDIPIEKDEFELCKIIGRVVGHFDKI